MKRLNKLLLISFVTILSINASAQCDTTEHKEEFKNGSYAVGMLVCEEKDGIWMYHDKNDRLIKKIHF